LKILILVLSYNDNGGTYSEFFEAQKKTWDSIIVPNVETYYYFGNSEENIIKNNEIHVTDTENSRCTNKLITTLKIINNFDFDILFRTNSSSYIDKKLLYDFLSNADCNKFYSGIINANVNPNARHIKKYGSGAGLCLSKDLVNLIVENENMINYNLVDDISIADILSKLDVFPINYGFSRWDYGYSKTQIEDDGFLKYFHYRLKTKNRIDDIKFMSKIFELKIDHRNI